MTHRITFPSYGHALRHLTTWLPMSDCSLRTLIFVKSEFIATFIASILTQANVPSIVLTNQMSDSDIYNHVQTLLTSAAHNTAILSDFQDDIPVSLMATSFHRIINIGLPSSHDQLNKRLFWFNENFTYMPYLISFLVPQDDPARIDDLTIVPDPK